MSYFNHSASLEIQRWGKGILGDHVIITEWNTFYFDHSENRTETADKIIDKLFRAAKKEDIEITVRENEYHDITRRIYVELGSDFRRYGIAKVGICDADGRFDDTQAMDAATAKSEIKSILFAIASKVALEEMEIA